MYEGSSVAVVVPAYNEAAHIRSVLESLPPLVDRVYVVDDASTDGTWDRIRDVVREAPSGRGFAGTGPIEAPGPPGSSDSGSGGSQESDTADGPELTDGGRPTRSARALPEELPVRVPNEDDGYAIVALRHGTNRGRGAAVKSGYRLAVRDGMDVVAVMDGDGQMDPDHLDRIVHPVAVGMADYAKANRLAGAGYWEGMSGWRLFGNVLLTGLTRVSSGYWSLRDPQNGYTAVSRSTLEAIDVDELYDDYGFLNDVLAKLNMAGARVADVPVPAVYGDEESGISYAQFVPGVSRLLATNFLRRLYVDGVHHGRVWLPAAYAAAAVGWLAAVLSAVGVAASAGGDPTSAAAVAGVALLATALAVSVDWYQNAGLEPRPDRAVELR